MMLATAKADRELGAFQIFWRFTRDVLLTGAIYALLIGATLALRYCVELLKESAVHYRVLQFLEYAIFFAGSLVVLLILAYVTVVTILDLLRSFKAAIGIPPNPSPVPAASPIQPSRTIAAGSSKQP
jgi:hypothetical protein